MTPERWEEVKAVLHAALERPPRERGVFVEAACSTDPALRREVDSLLAAHDGATDYLGVPAAVAPEIAAGSSHARLAAHLTGQYVIERELGRGGMATVYLARDLRHKRPVALKALHPYLAQSVVAERFLREIETAANLQHPHVLPLYDSGAAGDDLYYVMPYVAGESLRDRLRREGSLAAGEALRITREVVSALDYAHRHGVVHRDVKPENVLLDEDGNAVVADFGIARAIRQATEPSAHARRGETLTQPGVIVGTPAYMAPEQAAGDAALDHRADLYSVGVIAHEMLTGQAPRPFGCIVRSPGDMQTPVPAVEHSSGARVPPSLRALIDALLQIRPEDRPPTATDVLRRLAQVQGELDRAAYRAPRARRWAAGAALSVAALGVGEAMIRREEPTTLSPQRVAVSVFANRTGEPALDIVGSMAVDWITRGLLQAPDVDVVDVGAVYLQGVDLRGAPTPPRTLARQNGAGTVIAGRYYKSSDTLLFQADVLDVLSGRVLKVVGPVRASAADPISGVEQLGYQVAAALAAAVDPRFNAFVAPTTRLPSLAAYQAYVRAQGLYWRGARAEAIAQFARAAALDSTFLSAPVWIAMASATASQCAVTDSVNAAVAKRREWLEELDQATLDMALARCRGDWDDAYAHARRRAELMPGSSNGKYGVARYAMLARRPADALKVLQTLDPARDFGWLPDSGKVLYWKWLGAAHHFAGEYDDELAAAERFARAHPDRLASVYLSIPALAGLGRGEEAVRRLERASDLPADAAIFDEVTPITPGRPAYVNNVGSLCFWAATELIAHAQPDAGRSAAALAVEWFRRRPAAEQASPEQRFTLARSLELLGEYGAAAELVDGLLAEQPRNVDYVGRSGVLAARRGRADHARWADTTLAALDGPYMRGYPSVYRALIAAALGQRGRAAALLRQAARRGVRVESPLSHKHSAFTNYWQYPPINVDPRLRG